MKLISAHIENFRSIEDSEEFEISELTCLVGKNEAGKTAILQALHGIKPIGEFKYEQLRDYPRRHVTRFSDRHPSGSSRVVKTKWEISQEEFELVAERLGPNWYNADEHGKYVVQINSHINENNTWNIEPNMNQSQCIDFLISKHKLDSTEKKAIKEAQSGSELAGLLENLSTRTPRQEALLADLSSMREKRPALLALDILLKCMPSFLYTSHYDRMSGEISITKLAQDKANNTLSVGDKIFLDFLEYAGTSLEELQSTTHYEDLKAKCEGASNDITDEIFQFWSQNEALGVEIELGEGKPKDAAPFNSGTVAKIRIRNEHHRVSVPLSERSAGFIWFFSFLAQFKQLKKSASNAILLLDEPGLTLHGKAQEDLLRYIQERLLPEHQVLYTTHSPFMVPPDKLEDVRVVEDVIVRSDNKVNVVGTKVSSEILSVEKDTVFPLQGHLGYEITQTLFVGPNTLLVEGPSDILYLQVLSNALKRLGREGLDTRWTMCPAGGIDKVWPFASLFGGNKINIAVLCDYGAGDKNKVEKLKTSQLLNLSQIFTTSDFCQKKESDVEDFFSPELYARIVNHAFSVPSAKSLKAADLAPAKSNQIRIVKAVEDAFRTLPADIQEFDHYTPAEWLLRNPEILDGKEKMIAETFDKFEEVFKTFNKLLSPKQTNTGVTCAVTHQQTAVTS